MGKQYKLTLNEKARGILIILITDKLIDIDNRTSKLLKEAEELNKLLEGLK